MKIKSNSLVGLPLDWAVALYKKISVVAWIADDRKAYFVVHSENFVTKDRDCMYSDPDDTFYPSVNWDCGMPILEEEEISIEYRESETIARKINRETGAVTIGIAGKQETLLAGMRCLIASVFGSEIDIPDDLIDLDTLQDDSLSRDVETLRLHPSISSETLLSRANGIKEQYLLTKCEASDVELAVEKLATECCLLFPDSSSAWSFLMEEPNEAAEEVPSDQPSEKADKPSSFKRMVEIEVMADSESAADQCVEAALSNLMGGDLVGSNILLNQRVLLVIEDGVVTEYKDKHVEVFQYYMADFMTDPTNYPPVPALFADLAQPLGLPIEKQ